MSILEKEGEIKSASDRSYCANWINNAFCNA